VAFIQEGQSSLDQALFQQSTLAARRAFACLSSCLHEVTLSAVFAETGGLHP
jgi:hypothetical protein